ncbi:hypothetical protein [Rhodococcus sp. IEGM 1379]|uniref:hypothetical protein n=1 Tax=Rhodococcus sp. IEGM 1379 TaxID=3047086 RepID=UPI0024B7B364|nr:hypothetical protein [Rhodococcus sp. IEGM 1379]MDI9917163.1 hypothetical protein [Rhodococcus sp. IEGM 1379]
MKTQYKWAIAASSVLLIGFVSVQQTGALWRDSVESPGGATITAGLLDISAGTSGVKQFNLAGFKLENKGPGDSIQMPLPVINSGNVQMSYLLDDVALNSATPPPLTLRVAKVTTEAACTATGNVGTELYNGPMDGAAFTAQLVPAGQMQVLCLRATLGSAAAAAQTSDATFTFAASSVSQ